MSGKCSLGRKGKVLQKGFGRSIRLGTNVGRDGLAGGFTLPETMVAVFAMGVMVAALFAALAFGFNSLKPAREDLRATQILLEKMEILRLCPFEQIQSSATNICYDPMDQSTGGGGVVYRVTVLTNAPTLAGLAYYSNNIVKITATATWTNGRVQRIRSMQTYASKNGIQSYVYSHPPP